MSKRFVQAILKHQATSHQLSYFGGKVGALGLLEPTCSCQDFQSRMEAVDEMFIESVRDNGVRNLEWINGLAGLGNYAICRQTPNMKLTRAVSNAIIARLGDAGDRTLNNLGIAHGVPGIILQLADYSSISGDDSAIPHIRRLVSLVMRYSGLPDGSVYSYNARETVNSRLGWCYGDLSVAIALVRAGTVLNDAKVLHHAVDLINHSASRSVASSEVSDSGLCHGSLGLAHLFQRCFLETDVSAAKTAAIRWLIYFVEEQMPDLNRNFQGFGFLEGMTGGAHAALSSLCDDFPHWDHVLWGRSNQF